VPPASLPEREEHPVCEAPTAKTAISRERRTKLEEQVQFVAVVRCDARSVLLQKKRGLIMQALTVEILVNKGKFQPEVAIAVAEAMDQAIVHADLVTVPILDSRLAVFKSEFAAFKAEIEARFATLQTRLILWIVGSSVGSTLLPKIMVALGNLISATRPA